MIKYVRTFVFDFFRLKCGILLGLIFFISISALSMLVLPRMFLLIVSPIYIWRFFNCYDGPLIYWWADAAVPFFIYGFLLGFIFSWAPKWRVKDGIFTFLLLIFVLCALALLFKDRSRSESCISEKLSENIKL